MHGSHVLLILTEICTLTLGLILLIFHVSAALIFLPIFLYRFVICKFSHILNPKLGKMITARGQFLASENFTDKTKSPRAAVIISLILKGHQDLEETRRLVNLKLLNAKESENKEEPKYPELKQYVTTWPSWFGFQFWKPEENFDIKAHVQLHQPKSQFEDDDLRQWIETLVNEPFEAEMSPWKMYVTNNFVDSNISSEEMTLFTVKAHHSLSDGYGWLYTLVEDLGSGIPVVPRPNFVIRTTWKQKLLYQLTFPIQSIYELSKFLFMTLHNHPWKITDEKKAWKQLYWKSPIIRIQKIKAIKQRFGVTFGSVIHSACTAASRRSLLSWNVEEINENKCIMNGGKNTDIGSLPSAIILPLPNHPKRLRNHCTGIYINLPTEHSDPIVRLMECERRLQKSKNSPKLFYGTVIPVISGSLTTGLAKILGRNRQLPVGISNFPLSASTKYQTVDKVLLHATIGAGAQVGVAGVNFQAYTYNEGIQFAVTAENSIMSHEDLKTLMHVLVEEIETLYALSLAA